MDIGVRALLVGFREAVAGVSDLTKEIDKATEAAKKMEPAGKSGADGIEAMSTSAKVAVASLGAASGVGLVWAIGNLVSHVKEGVDNVRTLGEQFVNLSQRTGVSIEKLGGLQLAAATSGLSMESMATGLQQLNRHIDAAGKGSGPAADAFARIGVSIRDSNGEIKSSDEIFRMVADRFSKLEDGAGKTSVAMELFGRAGAQMIPLLNEGAAGLAKLEEEARKAGIVLDKDTAEAANKLNANLEVLSAYGKGFWMQVASPIVDGLAKITTAMREARLEGEGLIGQMLAGSRKGLQFFAGVADDKQELAGTLATLQRLYVERARVQGQADQGFQVGGQLQDLDAQIAMHEATRNRLVQVGAIGGALDVTGESPRGKDRVTDAVDRQREAKEQKEAEERAKAEVMVADMAAHDTAEAWKFYFQFKKAEEKKEQKENEDAAKAEVTLNEMAAHDTAEAWKFYFQYKKAEEEKAAKASEEIFGKQQSAFVTTARATHTALSTGIAEVLKGHETVGQAASNVLRRTASSMIDSIAKSASEAALKPLMEPLKKAFADMGTWVKENVFQKLFEGASNSFGSMLSGLGNLFGSGEIADAAEMFEASAGEELTAAFMQEGAATEMVAASVTQEAAATEMTAASAGMGAAAAAMGAAALGIAGAFNVATSFKNNPVGSALTVGANLGVGIAALSLAPFGGGGIGGLGFASGTDMIVSSPTRFTAGEAGAERVTVSPLSGAARNRSGAGTIVFSGLNIVDEYTLRRARYKFANG